MKVEVAKQWAEALRSGKYEQGQAQLRRADFYCCLGVLCDISGIGEWNTADGYNIGEFGYSFNIPSEIRSWSGLSDSGGMILAGINDNKRDRTKFPEIADYIDCNYQSL